MLDGGEVALELGDQAVVGAAGAIGMPANLAPGPDIEAELQKNFQLAETLGATGTPLFVIGNRVINSAVGYDALKQAIADARAKG